jgi:hypothetical protein
MGISHGTVEREVTVTIRGITGADPIVPPHGTRTIRPETVHIIYAGQGYVQVKVEGRVVKRDGSVSSNRASGQWSHQEGQPASHYEWPSDTSHAPQWVREMCERFAPGDFTSVS